MERREQLRTLLEAIPRRPAEEFARRYFGRCRAHREEAAAVYEALEELALAPLRALDVDTPLVDVLPGVRLKRLMEAVATMASVQHVTEEEVNPLDAWSAFVAQRLLGSAANSTTWDATTVWVRSVRGIVNERVRWRDPCDCP